MKHCRIFAFFLIFTLLFAGTAFAHELWIEVKYKAADDELQADIFWGHFGDFVDNANADNYTMFVRYPDGQTEELAVEKQGMQGRSYMTPKGEGEYVFWALRKPSTRTAEDGITRLSVQLAKTVVVVGEGPATSTEETGMPFEIMPLSGLPTVPGPFSGKVLLDGEPSAGMDVSAYGPDGATLQATTAEDGTFGLTIPVAGSWLVKVSGQFAEEGTLDEVQYTETGKTSTIGFSVPEEANSASPVMTAASAGTAAFGGSDSILTFFTGLFLGAAAALFFKQRKKQAA